MTYNLRQIISRANRLTKGGEMTRSEALRLSWKVERRRVLIRAAHSIGGKVWISQAGEVRVYIRSGVLSLGFITVSEKPKLKKYNGFWVSGPLVENAVDKISA